MDATVSPQALGMGVTRPGSTELAEAVREHRAAMASKDLDWQRRTASRVEQLTMRLSERT